jgi:membrane protease YdiL (CAAX protease family)
LYNFLEYGINKVLFNKTKFLLLIEFTVLFAAFPLSVVLGFAAVETRWLIWTITAIYLLTVILGRKPNSAALGLSALSFRRLWALMIVAAAILTALYLFFVFHWLDRKLLVRLFIILFLYPLLSVPAQEFFFRSFFFFRYGQVFEPRLLIVVNTLSFAFYHMIFGSWIATLASLAAGFVLSILYHKYRNFSLNCIIHTMFGILVFLMGWSGHFTTLRVFAN